jgi:hypothetical protein
MRVLVMSRPVTGQESGATAVLVAILSTVLFGMAAFTTDLGMAFVSKRQLQTASDAAAIAAASVYTEYPGNCPALRDDSAAKTLAQAAGDDLRESNRPGSSGESLSVLCSPDGHLEVSYKSSGDTPVYFGGVLGHDEDEIQASRTATATVDVPDSVVGMRPYAMCSHDLPDSGFPSTVRKVAFPQTGPAASPCKKLSGGWWAVQCPDEPKDIEKQTREGCDNAVGVVPGQDAHVGDPVALSDHLVNSSEGCGGGLDQDCLEADTGTDLFNGHGLASVWRGLLGQTIVIPVFCGGSDCDEDAIDGTGTNGRYPVHRLAAVTVCGFHFKKQSDSWEQIEDGVCGDDNNPNGWNAADGGNDQVYFLFVFSTVQTSGTTGASTCALGDAECDSGLRRVLLTQ